SITFVSASGKEKTVKVTVKDAPEENATIEAHDFEVDYGFDLTDEAAIEKAGAKATDKYGKSEGVTVKESNVDTSKPGEYSITFVSASGKEKTVKVTVKESVKAETPVFETPYIYGDTLNGKTSPNASVDVRVGAPSTIDFTIQADDKGDFSIPAEKLKQYNDYKVGKMIYATASFGTAGSISSLGMVTVEENHSSIEANDFEVDYGFDLTDEAAIEKAGAKATDKYGKSEGVTVKESNVDTSKPGEYSITFVSDSGKEKTVKVTVKNKPIIGSEPIIHATDTTYQVGETLNPLLGVTAEDPEDGDLTDQVKADASGVNMSKAGDYELKLSVTDEDGNTTEQTVTVHVVDQVTDGPVIKGTDDVRVDERAKFDPLEGVTAKDSQGNDITDNLTYTGSVDTSTPGEYTIKYYVYDKDGKVATAERVVTVQSDASKPVVMSPDKLTIKQNSKFDPTLYAQAYDNEDGDITDQIKVLGQIYTDKLGSQFITYEVTDSDGNKATKMMEVEVVATLGNAPVISGADDLEINVGDTFDPISGVTAYDNEDGDLTSEIKYGGIVDTGKAGEYTVTYTVWDSDFNVETVERKVTVKDPTVEPAIEAHDFEVDYGFDLTDEAAIEKAEAKATDKYGKEEGVKVKESNVDTSKPGEYSVTFISDSGKEKTVKVTVKDAPAENATIEAHDFEVDYGFDLTDEAALEKAEAKATDKYGKEEAVTVKETNVDTSKPGEYSITFVSASGKEKTVKVTVKDAPEENATIEAHDFEVDYGFDLTDEAAIEKAEAKATDKYGKEEAVTVKETNVDTSKPGEYSITFVSASGKEKTVKVTVNAEAAMKPTVDPIKEGAGKVTGQGKAGDKIVITVDGKEVGTGTVKEDGTFEILTGTYRAKAGDVYSVQAFNSENEGSEITDAKVIATAGKVNPDEYTIGDANVTGSYTGDVTSIAVFINGVNKGTISGASVKDGQFTYYVGKNIKMGDVVTVVGYDKYGKRLDEKELTIYNKETIQTPTVNDIYVGDTTVTGTGQAGTTVYVKLGSTILGQAEVKEDGTFEVTIPAQKAGTELTILAKDGDNVSESVTKTVMDQLPDTPIVDDVKEGAGKVTGKGKAGDTIVIKVNDKEIGRGKVKENGTFEILTGTYRAEQGDTYEVYAVNDDNIQSETVRKNVMATSGQVKPDSYVIGELSITGTYIGDVTTIAVFVDGIELGKSSEANVSNGQFNFYVGDHIKAGQKVTVVGYDKYGKRLDEKEVTIDNGVETPTVNDIYAGDTTVTGTGEAGSTVYVKDHLKNIIGQAEVKADGTYEVTIPAQAKDTQLIVMAKKGNARSEEVNATVLAARPMQPTVDAVKEGAGKITGTAQAGDTVVITLNGKEVGRGEVSEDGTFSIILSSKVRAGNKYEITAVNSDGISSVATEVTATATEGTITPDPFKVGGNSITGTFTGDVSSIDLVIDGAPQGVVSGNSVKNGVFSYYVGKLSIQADQTVEVVAYDAYGKQLDQQAVTINA
ncbi:immunoglobulin-like domain-containing protein, partial [Enterococcus mundtii]